MPRVAKQRRFRRKDRIQRKQLREENGQEPEDRRREEAEGWAALIEYLEAKNNSFDD